MYLDNNKIRSIYVKIHLSINSNICNTLLVSRKTIKYNKTVIKSHESMFFLKAKNK